MSITDELREYTEEQIKWLDMTKVHYRKLLAIADRIDAKHKSACGEAYSKGMKSIWLPDPTEYIRLPVDADGIPIHEGDVMKHQTCVDTAIVCGVGHNTFFTRDNHGEFSRHPASTYVHYRAPTVEDVLSEMLDAVDDDRYGQNRIIAEYASKLRLAGDAE